MNRALPNGGWKEPAANPGRLIARLRASSPWWDRRRAVEELSAAGIDPGVLFRLLRDERAVRVRLAMIRAAERATGAQIVGVADALLGEIDHDDAVVAAAAIRALGVLGVETARDEVVAVLDDWCRAAAAKPSDWHPFRIVEAALDYLTRLGPPEVAGHFVPLLASPWRPMRRRATRAIVSLQYRPASLALIEALERCLALPSRGDAEAEEARGYIGALRGLEAREAVPVLIRTAREAVGLRSLAVQALLKLGPEQSAPALVDMLADPGVKLRRQLLRLMVKADCRAALPAIRALLRAERHDVRLAALRALAELGDADAADAVRGICLTDPNPFVRPEAVRTLSRLLGPDAVPTLAALRDDTNAEVCHAAAAEIAKLAATPSERTTTAAVPLWMREIQ